jgi:DNA replication regulator DPB11
MWETLLKPRGFEIAAGKLVRSPSKSQGGQGRPQFPPSPLPPPRLAESGRGGSIIDSFRRGNSFANLQPKEKSSARLPFRRIPTSGSLLGKNGESSSSSSFNVPPQDIPNPSSLSSSSSELFKGLKFRTLGEAKSASVRSAVEGCCGRIPSREDSDEEVDYIIVRLVRYANILLFLEALLDG